MKIEISQTTFSRLQKHASPLVETVEDVINKMADAYEGKECQDDRAQHESEETADLSDLYQSGSLKKGTTAEILWSYVISKFDKDTFSLVDVYNKEEIVKSMRPDNKHIRSAIRESLQQLRNKGYIEFINNQGSYKKLRK